MGDLLKMLQYGFVQRALIAGLVITVCAALLGVILVLKNYSMMGHGLSDVGFMALTLALALGWSPIFVSVPIVIAASFFIMFVSQRRNIRGDVVIGMMATSSLAVGMIILSLNNGFSTNVRNYMFGSILAIGTADLIMSVVVGLITVAVFVLMYNRLFAVTYDESFASALGVKTAGYQLVIAMLTALTVVIGMRMMGTLLISSLVIFPAMTGKAIAKGFGGMVIWAGIIGAVCFLLGMVFTLVFDNVPAGASIVLMNVAAFATANVVRLCRKR